MEFLNVLWWASVEQTFVLTCVAYVLAALGMFGNDFFCEEAEVAASA